MSITTFNTKYGDLNGVNAHELYFNGNLKECQLTEYNELKTPYGTLIPQFKNDSIRRNNVPSLYFFHNGNLKKIALQSSVKIKTCLGLLSTEYLTFYEDGTLRRVFPLNGKLSGYWSEEDEYELAEDIYFDFSFGKFSKKVIGIQFYENGNVKSVTFWPKEKIDITTSIGIIPTRIGLSLYENGNIKSLEPRIPIEISTDIGKITSYDISAVGINGDLNSICFFENGKIKSLKTTSNEVRAISLSGEVKVFSPIISESYIGDNSKEIVPLDIEFSCDKVIFNKKDELVIHEYNFEIGRFYSNIKSSCSSCSSCNGCS